MPAEPRRVLASFATAAYYETLDQLVKSARTQVDGYLCFRDVDLPPAFYHRNERHFADDLGFGYWVWKPYVIGEALERVADGDIVLYCDAGNLVVDDLGPLFALCASSEHGVLLFDNRDHHPEGNAWRNSTWTKPEAFVLLDATTPEYFDGWLVNASYLLVQKRPSAVHFVADYLSTTENYDVVSEPQSVGADAHPEFVEHRYDQSVLSILATRHGIPLHRDPSEHGNDAIVGTDAYQQVFDHHRTRFLAPPDSAAVMAARRSASLRARAKRLLRRRNQIVWLSASDRRVHTETAGSNRPTALDALASPIADVSSGDAPTYPDLMRALAGRLESVRFLATGVTADWERSERWPFNLVFSDTLRAPDALREEWDHLIGQRMLDPRRGAMVWADLRHPGRLETVASFRGSLTDYLGRPPALFGCTRVRGLPGDQEPEHLVGVASWGGGIARWRSVFDPTLAEWLARIPPG